MTIFASGDRHEDEYYFLLCTLVYNLNFCHMELKTKGRINKGEMREHKFKGRNVGLLILVSSTAPNIMPGLI